MTVFFAFNLYSVWDKIGTLRVEVFAPFGLVEHFNVGFHYSSKWLKWGIGLPTLKTEWLGAYQAGRKGRGTVSHLSSNWSIIQGFRSSSVSKLVKD